MSPKMMVGAICLVSAATFAACRPAQSLDTAATDQPLKVESQQPANVTPKKAVAKPAESAVSHAVASNGAKTDLTRATDVRLAAAMDDESVSATITGCLTGRQLRARSPHATSKRCD